VRARCLLLPIEPIEQRYTAQWLEWWPAALSAAGFDVGVLHPDVGSGSLSAEQFLDPLQTHAYKAAQVEMLVAAARAGVPSTVVFLDAWHPGVISAAYMRDVAGLPLRLVGILHAGTYDPHDRLAQAGCGAWARGFEDSVLRSLDDAVVATRYHRTLLASAGLPVERVTVSPLPVRMAPTARGGRRERLVVWPHRAVPEKQTWIWRAAVDQLRPSWPGWRFVETLEATGSKAEYHALLGSAYLCVSAALQETFGIAMVEAAQMGCRVIVPRRLSYPELFAEGCFAEVDTVEDMVGAIGRVLSGYAVDPVGVWHDGSGATGEGVRAGDRVIAEHWHRLGAVG
jgi:hypothetical protein